MILDFGKYQGHDITSVPLSYLKWLCCYDMCFVCKCPDNDYSGCECEEFTLCKRNDYQTANRDYLYHTKRHVIDCARKLAKERKLCLHCFKKLIPIGLSRVNGKDHADWDTRYLHKKCWKSLHDE